jgi:hypothetical protein
MTAGRASACGSDPHGTYRNDARWDSADRTIQFTVDLHNGVDARAVRCRVPWDALCDVARCADKGDAAKAMQLYDLFRGRIEAVVDAKVGGAHYEPDGSLLVTSAELAY